MKETIGTQPRRMFRSVHCDVRYWSVFVLLFAVVGCDHGSSGNSSPAADANAALKTQLDHWVARQSGSDFDKSPSEIDTVLLRYEIPSFIRMTTGTQPLAYPEGDWYRATVNLTFQSQAGTDISRQHQWVVFRQTKTSPWQFDYDNSTD